MAILQISIPSTASCMCVCVYTSGRMTLIICFIFLTPQLFGILRSQNLNIDVDTSSFMRWMQC